MLLFGLLYFNIFSFPQDSANGTPVTLRVDEKGYFLYWTDQNKVDNFYSNTHAIDIIILTLLCFCLFDQYKMFV